MNPETNSDSPSAKSNGVRLVSAKIVVNHINVSGRNKRALIDEEEAVIKDRSRDAWRMSGETKIRAILTS